MWGTLAVQMVRRSACGGNGGTGAAQETHDGPATRHRTMRDACATVEEAIRGRSLNADAMVGVRSGATGANMARHMTEAYMNTHIVCIHLVSAWSAVLLVLVVFAWCGVGGSCVCAPCWCASRAFAWPT